MSGLTVVCCLSCEPVKYYFKEEPTMRCWTVCLRIAAARFSAHKLILHEAEAVSGINKCNFKSEARKMPINSKQ